LGWDEVLADMERRLVAAERALYYGGAPPVAFSLPAGLGPLPADLAGRAGRIQGDTARMTARVSDARDLVAAALHRPPERVSAPPAYVDARA
jgi:hypothetical protein